MTRKKRGFTPLHPESPSLQAGDEWQVKSESTGKPRPLGRGVTGFTLIETLMTVLLFSLLFGLTFEILVVSNRSRLVTSELQNIQNQARIGLERMCLELYQTRILNMEPVPPFASSGYIRFQMNLGFDASSNPRWGADGNDNYKIHFERDGSNNLKRQVLDAGGNVVAVGQLASSVSGLIFSLSSTTTKTLTVTVTTTSASGTFTLSSKVTLRN